MKIWAAAGCLLLAAPAAAQENLANLAQLQRATVGMFSSYDRTGGNDDGFSGKYSYLRKEGDGLVIAELKGRGAITRIFTPTSIDAPIEFWIDGENRPSIVLPFRQLFLGKHAPFTGKRVGHGVGGYYSYVPIAFAKSIKVIVRAPKLQFYQINYALFDKPLAPSPASAPRTVEAMADLLPGKAVTLFETNRPGRISSLRLDAAALASPARDITLRITWDGATVPALEVPAADLLGYSFGNPSACSILFGTEGKWSYLEAPMPFARSAKVELVSRRSTSVRVPFRLAVSDLGKRPDEAWFHARWTREAETVRGKPFELLDVRGRGHVVGFTVQAQGATPGDTGFFEGDDMVDIDGRPAIRGTGTEDAFNGGWYGLPGKWDRRGAEPYSGALDYSRQISRTGGYRVLLADAYRFEKSLRFTLEHGPQNNAADGDYTGTTLFYVDRPDGLPPSALPRPVADLPAFRVAFFPEVGFDSMVNASIVPAGRQTATGWVSTIRFARAMQGTPEGLNADNDSDFTDDVFGPPMLVLAVDAPRAGRYRIHAEALTGPDSAILQLAEGDQPLGAPLDLYSSAPGRVATLLGEIELKAGRNPLAVMLRGRNAASTGQQAELIAIEGRLADGDRPAAP